MNYRPLGRTGWNVSEISFGAWAIGGFWGNVSDADSLAALNQAIDESVNFIETACGIFRRILLIFCSYIARQPNSSITRRYSEFSTIWLRPERFATTV